MSHLSFSKYNVRMGHLKHSGLDWMVRMLIAKLTVFYNNSHFWVTTCNVNRNTEAPCRVSGDSERKHFAGSYETVTCDRPLFEFCWTVIFISLLFIFNRKHLSGKPCGCLSSASSEDCRNHEPLSVSARFFCLSASKFFSSCSDSQAPLLLSPMNSFLFYLSPFAFTF